MDMKTGRIYESDEAAREAGVKHPVRVRSAQEVRENPYVCEKCRRIVPNRSSTPRKQCDDGVVRRWCKRCWYKKGVR